MLLSDQLSRLIGTLYIFFGRANIAFFSLLRAFRSILYNKSVIFRRCFLFECNSSTGYQYELDQYKPSFVIKNVRYKMSASQSAKLNSMNEQFTSISDSDLGDRQKCKCFCFNAKIKKATSFVAVVSSFFIISNLIVKIIGYSEIGWNFELLFIFVDGVAVLSMIYGLYAENAAFLQPFVVLSIITISLMILLAAYLCTAMVDPSSWASQELELELNKRLSDVAKQMRLEFKFIVSLVATIAFVGIFISIFLHLWFVYLTVQCAKHFRRLS